ncbi:unnamed protein product [Ilex paraguariensis]|uniref:Uncharacterized protein n=1 Tax=Ilex paraguariensis TaxID=185542 RepID=A0ABC8U049_9AQUA
MESNRKRKGLTKAKLVMSFYRAAKPSSTTQYSGKVKPNPTPTSTTTVGFIVNQDQVTTPPPSSVGFVFNQDHVISQTKQKVSFAIPGDEAVDVKAASYISCVQERFRLELVNSERKRSEEYTH